MSELEKKYMIISIVGSITLIILLVFGFLTMSSNSIISYVLIILSVIIALITVKLRSKLRDKIEK